MQASTPLSSDLVNGRSVSSSPSSPATFFIPIFNPTSPPSQYPPSSSLPVLTSPSRHKTLIIGSFTFMIRSRSHPMALESTRIHFPDFLSSENTTVMRLTVDLKKRSVPLEINMEMKAAIKVGRLKKKKFGMKVQCYGIEISVPKGKKPPQASTLDTSC